MRQGVSIVICTFNGAALLPETIRHVAQQCVRKSICWEIIVVDNASTDNTAQVAKTEWGKYNNPADFSLLYEPKQGLTYARDLALKKSRYEFVVFCDDDNWLNPDYVNLAYQLMMRRPEIGVLGGRGKLVFENPPPSWASGHGFFANGPQAYTSGKVTNHIVYGAGCVIRKSAYRALIVSGFKPMLTDRKGARLSSGGDYELCYAIALAGYDIWYESRLTFEHFMPAARIKWEYYMRFIKEGLQCFEVIVPYRIRVSMGAKSIPAFYLKATLILLSYIAKLCKVLVSKAKTYPTSEEACYYTLQQHSLKYKIKSFLKIQAMLANFREIKAFEQSNLKLNRYSKYTPATQNQTKHTSILVR